jgi:hypothetical protein
MRPLVLSLLVSLAAPAGAQAILECGWVGNPAYIVEPWEANTRTFANGAIRLALIDTDGEPVCCPIHLLILAPVGEVEGPAWRACHLLSDSAPGIGFNEIDLQGVAASYDPALGLRLDVPVWRYTDGLDRGRPGRVAVRINQATGSVTLEPASK